MNIQELDAYNLDDAVKFNDRLNPRLWDASEHLRDDVRAQLLLIAEDFKEFLGVKDLDLADITVSGSNAAYTYTPNSDIDLHLVVNMPEDEVYRELFDAKKGQYNDQHNIKIGGYDVELYVQDADAPHISQGIYSLLNNDWVQVPRRVKSVVDDTSTENKFKTVGRAIERAIKSGDMARMDQLARKIKKMRQTGLENHGEFGPENLAFKMLRSQGKIKELHDARIRAKDQLLSLKEKAPARPFVNGFKTPPKPKLIKAAPTLTVAEDTSPQSDEEILKDFINFCFKELKLKAMPIVKLRKDPQWSVVNKTFGRYTDDRNLLEVSWGQRHIMDVLRTVAHELTHRRQHERESVPSDAGETGSPWENEANARAGVLMRDYGRLHPELFDAGETELEESASGYIPTKKQAKDPRWSMALTQDIRPGQLGKEANKLNLKTNKQGHPQVANPNGLFEKLALELNQFKRRGTLAESEQLDEVRMAPSNLQQFANSPEAEGIQAGFEAELIFRDALNDDDDEDMEPDYDMDERARSIDQVVEFFQDDEWGYGLSERQASRLRDSLDEQYMEWMDGEMYNSWRDERDELIKEAWLREKPMAERIHAFLVDGMDFDDRQADAIQAVGEKEAPRFNTSKEEQAYAEANPDYATYLEALEGAEEILQEDVEQTIEKEDGFYDEVLDDFRNDFYVDDDSSFFDDVGLRWMSDVANTYDLGWPYLTGGSNGGSRDWEEIGDSLNKAIDMPVKVSSGYHSATRKPGLWIVEPDSSLQPDDREDYGLEIVSPPMPLKQALEKLQQVTDWANSDEGNAYTNDSTGLHMGVSIPYKEGRVDYLKLILFLGDEYVLQQYGREANTYTKAAMKDIRSRAGSERNATAVLELLKSNLLELAERELVRNTGEGKYTSAHKQDKYIEFRSAGGDWLAEDNAEPGKLENTMMRYAYAMYLAGRPDLERREYAKKLYKLVAGSGDDSAIALFSQYAAGEIDKQQLKKRWAEKTLSKEAPSAIAKGNWVVVDNNTGKTVQGQEYNGFTEDEVRERAKAKISPASSDRDFDQAYSIHPKETGKWEVYRDDQGKEETLEIIDADRRGEAVDLAYDKYTGVIPFKVRAYYGDEPATPEKELSPRAKLAKRITKPKQTQDYDVVYRPTGRVIDSILRVDAEEAQRLLSKVAQQHDFKNTDDLELRVQGAESEPDVGQNFADTGDWEFYRTETGNVIDRVDGINKPQANAVRADIVRRYGHPDASVGMRRVGQTAPGTNQLQQATAPVDATETRRNWEFVDRITGRVIHIMTNATYNQATVIQDNLERQNPDADISLRSVELTENFADGKGPGRPGDSQRHGIPKGATIAQLEKAAKAPGRKGQLARWQLNMRRGKKK